MVTSSLKCRCPIELARPLETFQFSWSQYNHSVHTSKLLHFESGHFMESTSLMATIIPDRHIESEK
jgi:hypothetical protein